MNRDQLEFAITQYLDGTLPPAQVSALEQLLQTDELTRELLADHQRLDAILKTGRQATAPPALDWDRIATTIGRFVAQRVEQALEHGVQAARADVLLAFVDDRGDLGQPLDAVRGE